jgi:hypothetical protein
MKQLRECLNAGLWGSRGYLNRLDEDVFFRHRQAIFDEAVNVKLDRESL